MITHYPYLLNPELYPDYTRRPFKAPTWDTFGHRTQFTSLRSLHQSTWKEDLDRYTEEYKLGRVIWPMTQVLYMPHIDEVIEELRRRDLFLFDLWSYVPGSSMVGMWSNITPPQGMVAHLEKTLGERFLGVDNGEQDGRYVAGYARQQCPNAQDRHSQYLHFMRHFERMCNELGNHMTALVSLSFGHYFVKEGHHALLGAETAQALPNSQVYYAFIRGACRQYGVHWFGNASTFNRWGYKNYELDGLTPDAGGYSACAPDLGASLCLLKRLMYSHILYNSVMAGFEMQWIKENKSVTPPRWELTPIGMIQQGAIRFVEEQGSVGVMHTPVALMLDFHAGWVVPRHLYSGDVYQVWGAMPYAAGDYLTHGVLSLLYPGYEDASYYRDERGFYSATPHGDMADIVLSDAPAWALRQYGIIVAAGELTPGEELRDTLRAFMEGGGHLVATGANARHLFPGLCIGAEVTPCPAGSCVRWANGTEDIEPDAFELLSAKLPEGAEVLASCGGQPAVFRFAVGEGKCTVLLSPFGLQQVPSVSGPLPIREDQPLPSPYALTAHAARALRDVFAAQQIFEVGEGLGFVTCRKAPGDYTVGIFNNTLGALPFKLASRRGTLRTVEEITLDQREKGQAGYWPTGMGNHDGGPSTDQSIAGGDVRVFRVTIAEQDVRCLPEVQPPPRPRDRFLALRGIESLQDAIHVRPTFFHHFDGVKMDWKYVASRDRAQIERERGWLARQQVRLIVDFSADINLFPGLSLLNNLPDRHAESLRAMDDALDKAARLGATEALITLHRQPENHCGPEQAEAEFTESVRRVCGMAERYGMTLHLQYQRLRWWGYRWWHDVPDGASRVVLEFVDRVGASNLRLALNTGHAQWMQEPLDLVIKTAGDRLGMILHSALQRDAFGQVYDAHAPVAGSEMDIAPLRQIAGIPQVLDAIYPDLDAEYRDCRFVW